MGINSDLMNSCSLLDRMLVELLAWHCLCSLFAVYLVTCLS